MRYLVEITEILQKQIEVEVDNEEEAIRLVKSQYYKGNIILDETNYIDTEISIFNKK